MPEPRPRVAETVLILDQDEQEALRMRDALQAGPDGASLQVVACGTAREALSLLTTRTPDLIITHIDLPDLGGERLLRLLRERSRDAPVIALVSHPGMQIGVAAVRAGALDVLERPVNRLLLAEATHRALHEARTTRQLARAREQQEDRQGFSHMLTQSPRMLRVFDQVRAVASTDATVLIRGATGTGKELVTRAIHMRSRRRDKPLISVNCGAFTESLLESELFGHEKGSFTGASGRRQGVFEMADGGTLFLDELGETSLNVQVSLLRVLEEMRFRRVGGHDPVPVDVRIIAATNVQLEEAVEAGRFRRDLYYRLNVFPIHLPELRERPEDIPLLVRHFLEDVSQEYDLEPPAVDPVAMERILAYGWPGNVRQLRAMCERWVIAARGGQVGLEHLPGEMVAHQPVDAPLPAAMSVDDRAPLKVVLDRTTAQIERAYLHRVLHRCRGHLSQTAAAAGITRRTLYTKMKAYGLDAGDYRG